MGQGWKQFAVAVAIGATVGSITTFAMTHTLPAPAAAVRYTPAAGSLQKVAATPQTGSDVVPDIYEKVVPSVVTVSVDVQQDYYTGHATGSGFVVDPRGYILTNYHVIDGASKITVTFVDGSSLSGKVIGSDRTEDLAVVQVDTGGKNLAAVTLGDSDNVRVGQLAIAIGSPYDNEFTVTAGIISATHRQIQEENNPVPIADALQTDAAINPGNSGGPLLNANGEVVGINTAINTPTGSSVGLGFAIPINAAKRILPSLLAGKKIDYGWLGIWVDNLTPAYASALNLSVTQGALVVDVYDGGPADRAGLQPATATQSGRLLSADVIIAADGTPIKNKNDLVNYIQSKRAGDTVVLTVLRGSRTLTIPITLQPQPDNLTGYDPNMAPTA